MQEFQIKSGKYVLEGDFFPPAEPQGKRFPVVIMCHALGASKENFRLTAEDFSRAGIGALTFNFRGGGKGDRSGMKGEDMTLFTEKEDLFCVFENFKEKPFVESISLFGASQGGMVATMFAEEHPEEISSLILLYPGFCIADHLRERFPNEVPETFHIFDLTLGRNYVLSMRDYDTFSQIGKFSRPVLILHGKEDKIVPISYSERAAKIYNKATLLKLEGEGHGFSKAGNMFAAKKSVEFLRSVRQ